MRTTGDLKACRYCGYVTAHHPNCAGMSRPSKFEQGYAACLADVVAWLRGSDPFDVIFTGMNIGERIADAIERGEAKGAANE